MLSFSFYNCEDVCYEIGLLLISSCHQMKYFQFYLPPKNPDQKLFNKTYTFLSPFFTNLLNSLTKIFCQLIRNDVTFNHYCLNLAKLDGDHGVRFLFFSPLLATGLSQQQIFFWLLPLGFSTFVSISSHLQHPPLSACPLSLYLLCDLPHFLLPDIYIFQSSISAIPPLHVFKPS